MIGQVTLDWGKFVAVVLWSMSVLALIYVTAAYLMGVRSLNLLVIGAWGLLAAAAAVTWTVSRAVEFATDRVLTMLDQPEELRPVGHWRGRSSG